MIRKSEDLFIYLCNLITPAVGSEARYRG